MLPHPPSHPSKWAPDTPHAVQAWEPSWHCLPLTATQPSGYLSIPWRVLPLLGSLSPSRHRLRMDNPGAPNLPSSAPRSAPAMGWTRLLIFQSALYQRSPPPPAHQTLAGRTASVCSRESPGPTAHQLQPGDTTGAVLVKAQRGGVTGRGRRSGGGGRPAALRARAAGVGRPESRGYEVGTGEEGCRWRAWGLSPIRPGSLGGLGGDCRGVSSKGWKQGRENGCVF